MRKTILIVLVFISFQGKSQLKLPSELPATSNSGGGTAIITKDFLLDWSIGESTITETFFGENSYSNSFVTRSWNVTSGVLQPFDKTHIVYNYLAPKWTNEEIRFYPIPTHNVVYIDFRSVAAGKISIQLLSRDGKLLGIKEFDLHYSTSTFKWDLTNKASGAYYFRILLLGPYGDLIKQGTFNIEKL